LTRSTLRNHIAAEIRDDVVKSAWNTLCDSYEGGQSDPEVLRQELFDALAPNAASGLSLSSYHIAELLLSGTEKLTALILRSGKTGSDDLSDEDLSSSFTVPVLLHEHNAAVGSRARALAESVGLGGHFQKTLWCGGTTHDLGKADPRCQRLLRAGDNATLPGQPLAKGLRRVRPVRVQDSERHEAYSVALLRKHPILLGNVPDPDLALYLAGVHHGRGRPIMPSRRDEGTSFTIAWGDRHLQFDGAPRLGDLGSGWPSLFWRLNQQYGPWGLAYLEALLRLADHLQSRDEMRKRNNHGRTNTPARTHRFSSARRAGRLRSAASRS